MELNAQELGMEYAVLFSETTQSIYSGDDEMNYYTENMIAFELCELRACCNKSNADGLDDLIWY